MLSFLGLFGISQDDNKFAFDKSIVQSREQLRNINGMSMCLTAEPEMSSQKCSVFKCFMTETLASVSP